MILHTQLLGHGEPIVILHTGLQTGQTDFKGQREHFKQNYQVILPDLRGHGNSISDDLSNYFHDSAKDLKDTLDDLGIGSAHILGCSLGALVGLVFAKNNPDQVKSLTLSGIIPEKPLDWEELNTQDVEHQQKILNNNKIVAHFDSLHKGDWKKFIEITQDGNWYPFEETGDVSMLKMPVLFLVGEGNKIETQGALLYPQMNDKIHVSIIPFAAHNVHLEQPEIYIKIVEEFLKKAKD